MFSDVTAEIFHVTPAAKLNDSPGDGGARQDTSIEQGMQVSMATLGVATTRHCHTDDSVEVLTCTHILTISTREGGR